MNPLSFVRGLFERVFPHLGAKRIDNVVGQIDGLVQQLKQGQEAASKAQFLARKKVQKREAKLLAYRAKKNGEINALQAQYDLATKVAANLQKLIEA